MKGCLFLAVLMVGLSTEGGQTWGFQISGTSLGASTLRGVNQKDESRTFVGPTKMWESFFKNLTVVGPFRGGQLEISEKLEIVGPAKVSRSKIGTVDVTGPARLFKVQGDVLKVVGPFQGNSITFAKKGVLVGPLRISDSSLQALEIVIGGSPFFKGGKKSYGAHAILRNTIVSDNVVIRPQKGRRLKIKETTTEGTSVTIEEELRVTSVQSKPLSGGESTPTIRLNAGTHVKGNIVFKKLSGKVIKDATSSIDGKVINGTLVSIQEKVVSSEKVPEKKKKTSQIKKSRQKNKVNASKDASLAA